MFLQVFISLLLAYFLWSLVRFIHNYNEAKKIGLPILITPINPSGPLWMLTKDFLIPVMSRLPFGLGDWATRGEMGWTFYTKYAIHAKHGDAFVIAGPGENDVVVADPAATEDVMRRRNDFIKNPAMYGMLDIYGPNLDTVNGKVWDRHRKITVPPFNEQNSALVWREAGEQAEQMLDVWTNRDTVRSTQPDVHALALNVLCGAGFGAHSGFVDTTLPSTDSNTCQKLGYRESLRMLLANIVQLVFLALMKRGGFPDWLLFGSMKKLAVAYEEFRAYMSEMLAREKSAFEQGDVSRHNLLSEMVRAMEGSGPTSTAAGGGGGGLTDEEVYGNLFIYNLAGHDTTAATLHFALTLLAVYPQWQTWIAEEIDAIHKADTSGLFYYEETFPKLTRILALMYETVRLYGPVVLMPRYTAESAQRLVIQGKEHIIPPRTTILLNFAALHRHPKYWGPDADDFRPDRWIVPAEADRPGNDNDSSSSPLLFQPEEAGSFVPWNLGPRICPGKKFSQVEFTRVIFTLFANGSRVELVNSNHRAQGESETEQGQEQGAKAKAKARALAVRIIDEAKVEVTLKMVKPERIALKWVKKS
ncbi:hypothetical protein LTS15_006523 [Exophiala xenobiotica]|nr:hypothetical protein LTS15_006523 [Exophiala xenobiotica]